MEVQSEVDTTRHNAVFSATAFATSRVDVIGCGATGSRIALSLAKLGIVNLHLWDFDEVEGHNIANQCFGMRDIGRKKVEALADIIRDQTGLSPTVHDERVDGSQPLGRVVFVLTDTMASRKEIWEKGIRFRNSVHLMVETRMGVDEGRIYCINPTNLAHVDKWQETLYGDETAAESACGSRITVGPTADLIAGHAVWSFIQWFNHSLSSGEKPMPPSEYLFGALSSGISCIHFE
jgi:hypothetical protein